MEVFKGEAKNNEGLATFDLSSSGKHLFFAKLKGKFIAGLYYDDCERKLDIREDFFVDSSDYYVISCLDKAFEGLNGEVFFTTLNSSLTMSKENDGYLFSFTRDHNDKKNIIEARFYDDTLENNAMRKFYHGIQAYDPSCRQIHMSELGYSKSLSKKIKKVYKSE